MTLSSQQLAQEATAATNALAGKVVARVVRYREAEVLVEFSDGTRLFVDRSAEGIEISITEGPATRASKDAP